MHNTNNRRGRPKGTKNRVPAKLHTNFIIRDVPPGTQALLAVMAMQAGITMGQVLALAVSEYAASRTSTSSRQSDQRYAEIRRLMGIEP